MTITLYDYPRSSASYRVRIALHLAGLTFDTVPVDLLARDHKGADHLARNPQGLVPVLDIDGLRLTQSLAIIEYLNDTRDLDLLPAEAADRARVRALAYALAIDVHPVCNLSVATHATGGQDQARTDWMRRFIGPGLAAFEVLLDGFEQAPYCTGTGVSLADICLIPQLYNADRWGVDYAGCKRVAGVKTACLAHPAFQAAVPQV